MHGAIGAECKAVDVRVLPVAAWCRGRTRRHDPYAARLGRHDERPARKGKYVLDVTRVPRVLRLIDQDPVRICEFPSHLDNFRLSEAAQTKRRRSRTVSTKARTP